MRARHAEIGSPPFALGDRAEIPSGNDFPPIPGVVVTSSYEGWVRGWQVTIRTAQGQKIKMPAGMFERVAG